MTVLVAYQGKGFAVIGADSRATDESGFLMNLATPKIVTNSGYLIAVSGASRGGNIAQFGWVPPKPPKSQNKTVLDRFVTAKLIPSLRTAFQKAGYDAKDDGEAAWQDSNLLIIFNGTIYPIFNDYSWDRDIRDLYVAGSGGELACGAIGALGLTPDWTPEEAETKIARSIEVACDWNAFCSLPIIVKTQFA
jgi:ATP-dependent protease HslVU (ClpYQ) peptidase subunit